MFVSAICITSAFPISVETDPLKESILYSIASMLVYGLCLIFLFWSNASSKFAGFIAGGLICIFIDLICAWLLNNEFISSYYRYYVSYYTYVVYYTLCAIFGWIGRNHARTDFYSNTSAMPVSDNDNG